MIASDASFDRWEGLLIQHVTPQVRIQLIRCRIAAMHGDWTTAEAAMRVALLSPTTSAQDRIAVGVTYAELLLLDSRIDEAVAIMQNNVEPFRSSVSKSAQIAVDENSQFLRMHGGLNFIGEFYNITDMKRLLNFQWLDYEELFSASQDTQRQRSNQSLPVLRQQHRRGYLTGCWRVQRLTNQLLSKEYLATGQLERAMFHAVQAVDDRLAVEIARAVAISCSGDVIQTLVQILLDQANLAAHFSVACKVLTDIWDLIPCSQLGATLDWLLRRASEVRESRVGPNHVSDSWKAVRSIAPRLSSAEADRVVACAIAHPLWNAVVASDNHVIINRDEIIKALIPVSSKVSNGVAYTLSEGTVRMHLERWQSHDHVDVVNLLCQLASRGDSILRDQMAEKLYPKGVAISRVLAQVSEVFGKGEIFDEERLAALALRVCDEIYAQVQLIKPGEVPQPAGEVWFEFSASYEGCALKVYSVGFNGLYALVRHRTKLPARSVELLITAILQLAQEEKNLCGNRLSLLQCLLGLLDVLPATQVRDTASKLEKLASGPLVESDIFPWSSSAQNPTASFRFSNAKPEDVQAAALIAFAKVVSLHPSYARRLAELIEDAICDPRPRMRQAAYAASQESAITSPGMLLGLLAGLRDPDESAAGSAFDALGERNGFKMNRNHWRVFLMACRIASFGGSAQLRKRVARTLRSRIGKCPPGMQPHAREVLQKLAADPSWTVRKAAGAEA